MAHADFVDDNGDEREHDAARRLKGKSRRLPLLRRLEVRLFSKLERSFGMSFIPAVLLGIGEHSGFGSEMCFLFYILLNPAAGIPTSWNVTYSNVESLSCLAGGAD